IEGWPGPARYSDRFPDPPRQEKTLTGRSGRRRSVGKRPDAVPVPGLPVLREDPPHAAPPERAGRFARCEEQRDRPSDPADRGRQDQSALPA
nr:hypothetical protein [Tanacetum cinerariifolium]